MNSRKQAMMDMQDKKYQPFPRSAIDRGLRSIVEQAGGCCRRLCQYRVHRLIELESFGSTALGSTGGVEIEAAWG